LKAFGKGACSQECVIVRQKGYFMLGRSVREYVMTWPEYKEGRIDDGCKMDIDAGTLF
jgi:hypothetical protein